ncbi:single-stranded DNA-binding protein [Streptococcus agalactiae]|uniref:single-stranded DNA-binding protein n=1 Tax=Streptococcus agalactiae TaxID=1311 RepID=UPI0013752958|nr:single-stranded DNA-binding protein [Streptococcus agalactiae]KAF1260957.1 single-stranded DNA-binding protein [Streptococcus agalactiae]KAF1271392.1 single-stranded DNA-binding protein [Streptococcus agalactiae]HEN0543792.1 single-stranded DNA-binding protein [Streptococcus agalactiae]HEO6299856.1 single-stranded DNA-binding protein [Streptococcus agalactiae]
MQTFIAYGRVASDVEIKKTINGKNSCRFEFVCDSGQLDDNKKPIPSFFHVQVYGKQAEVVSESLSKGSPILVEGEIVQKPYVDKQGNRKIFQYLAPNLYKGIIFLETKAASQKRQGKQDNNQKQYQNVEEAFSPVDAESPF